jgi:8-oxo-dGTP pyrophosphatase MutT (NUDIX family)
MVGSELLLLPSVAVLPWDEDGRLLMVRDAATGQWMTIGGMIEPDETPRAAAVREGLEETGLHFEIAALRDVIGGPDYWVTYPNGDRVAYVSPVFDARVIGGTIQADGAEVSEVRWWTPAEIEHALDINDFTRAMLRDVGVFAPRTS